jgi:hypothetical protein
VLPEGCRWEGCVMEMHAEKGCVGEVHVGKGCVLARCLLCVAESCRGEDVGQHRKESGDVS